MSTCHTGYLPNTFPIGAVKTYKSLSHIPKSYSPESFSVKHAHLLGVPHQLLSLYIYIYIYIRCENRCYWALNPHVSHSMLKFPRFLRGLRFHSIPGHQISTELGPPGRHTQEGSIHTTKFPAWEPHPLVSCPTSTMLSWGCWIIGGRDSEFTMSIMDWNIWIAKKTLATYGTCIQYNCMIQ